MPANDEFAPCSLIDHEDGAFSLIFTDFDSTEEIFAEQELDGGGYTWHAIVDSLVKMKTPKIARLLDYDPEAGMFAAISRDRDSLKQVAVLIRNALKDRELLQLAIDNADPELLE